MEPLIIPLETTTIRDTNKIIIYKPLGYTPSQLMEAIFFQFPEVKTKKYSFYGKLDPMAHGQMVILLEEECKNPIYQSLDKTYQAMIVLGIQTDTYDLMGKVIAQSEPCFNLSQLTSLVGKHQQPYPPYSYVKVQGKPLWWWSKNNRLAEIRIPTKEITIYEIKLLAESTITIQDIQHLAQQRIPQVVGDFRQTEIIENWSTVPYQTYPLLKIEAYVSCGTYIRHLANQLHGFALEIYRKNVHLPSK